MCKTAFEQVIVIGYGIVTRNVLEVVNELSAEYGYSVAYIEHEIHGFNQALKYCIQKNIKTKTIPNKKVLTNYFMSVIDKNTLIVSASNNYLFPREIIENEHVTIINFHNALLPDYPGRNAPSWAIYDNNMKTGITWHYVTVGIDEGDIILQKACEIGVNIKAYELVAELMDLASEAFQECYTDILQDKIVPHRQIIKKVRKVYKSSEVPGNGRFELSDPPDYIWRLLRATDYGKNDIFPMITTEYKGTKIRIKRYKAVQNSDIKVIENSLYIPFDEKMSLFLKYEILS